VLNCRAYDAILIESGTSCQPLIRAAACPTTKVYST